MARKDIYKDAKKFEKNDSRINKAGRPKKIYTILKEQGFGKDDILTVFKELVWYTLPELKKMFDDISKPAIVRITANQIYTALKSSDMTKIKEIMQYSLGMPKQQVETENTTKLTLEDKLKDIIKISFIDNTVNENDI